MLRLYYGKQIGSITSGKRKIRYVVGKGRRSKRDRKRFYGDDVTEVLKKIRAVLVMPCGKRLSPFLPEIILKLENFGEIEMKNDTKQKLLKVSVSTIDRILKPIKDKLRIGKRKSPLQNQGPFLNTRYQ